MQKPPADSETVAGTEPAMAPTSARWRRLRAACHLGKQATCRLLGLTWKLVLLSYFAFAILFLVLRYAILPNIDFYKGDLERLASKALGNPVRIERVYASWRGLRPNLFLGDVSLRDGAGQQVLSLPSVSATLSWWSVLAGGVRFESLEILGPALELRREADGKVYAAGMLLNPDRPGADSGAADWLLSQREIVIRNGRLHWVDGQRGGAELVLDQFNLVLRNKWRQHQLALQAVPPAALAAPLDVRARFSHPAFARISDLKRWKGEVYADLKQVDLAAWKSYLDYPFALHGGRGALRAWVALDHARVTGVTADLALADVAASLGDASAPQALDIARLRGRFGLKQQFASTGAQVRERSVSVSDLSLLMRDGLSLAPTTLAARLVAGRAGAAERGVLRVGQLDLRTVAALAARLPLAQAQRDLLAELAPRGLLRAGSLDWQGPLTAPHTYRIQGQMSGLGLDPLPARLAQAAKPGQPGQPGQPARAAAPALPGVDNVSGTFDISERGGKVALDAVNLQLNLPAYFAEPVLPFEQFRLNAHWAMQQPRQDSVRVQIDAFHFVQQGMRGSVQGSYVLPLHGGAKGLGVADLSGTLDQFDIQHIGRYLPLATPTHLRAWLTGALEQGMARDVTLRLRGELAQFPFKGETAAEKGRGEFRIGGRLDNARLNYAPGHAGADGKGPLWPQAEHIKGSFLFQRAGMDIRGDSATTGGVALSQVKAVIADLGSADKLLEIEGNAYGPMQEYVKYVSASPVLDWIGRFTDQTTATGNARLALKLRLPLERLPESAVQGALQLLGNEVVLFHDLPPVQGATGKIEFNERGVNLNGLGGTFLGGPTAISGGTQRDNSIQVKLGGSVTADGLRRYFSGPAMQRLTERISGGARYSGVITAREHQVQVAVDSTLVGLGLNFPAPLKKGAADPMALHFNMQSGAPNEAGLTRDEIRIGLGAGIAARYERQRQGNGAWRVVRGGIGVNLPAPEPDSGMMVNVNLKSLDVDAWTALGAGVAGAGGPTGGATAGPDLAQYAVPDVMAARAGQLLLGGRTLENVVVGATHQKGVWQANIDSAQASGYVTWNENAAGGMGKVTARLSSLIIPESAAAEVKDLLEGQSGTAATIPALDIVAERFELFNKVLGRLDLQAYNAIGAQAAGAREWRVSKLSLANPDGHLAGSGKWTVKDGHSDTKLDFVLDIADAGKLLDRFGFVDTVRRGKGSLSGEIAWQGLPYALDIPSLSGKIDMKVESGQFLKQDPGAAKLLGVLSLQALPRLLKLDFHDVFSEGLAFDGIAAAATIERGVVKTDNLKMHGVAATVLMDGSADIANESTDLHVVVIPEFNLGTGPLVYALAVNPVIGIGSFLAQLFLRAPVMKALTYQMRITGPWKAPVITKLDGGKPAPPRPLAAPLPAAAPVPAN
ncbi:MAG: YhdP family protein [Pseudomonadota bacterium]